MKSGFSALMLGDDEEYLTSPSVATGWERVSRIGSLRFVGSEDPKARQHLGNEGGRTCVLLPASSALVFCCLSEANGRAACRSALLWSLYDMTDD